MTSKAIKKAAAIAVAAAALSGCRIPSPQSFYADENGTIHPVMIRSEFEMQEMVNQHRSWNIEPPTRLDVIMEVWEPQDFIVKAANLRCDDFGGEFIWYESSDQWLCEGVDY